MPKKTFECAELANAVLITQAKGNQDILKKQIAHGCGHHLPIDRHDDPLEKRHGRLERRSYEVFEVLPMLKNWQNEWPFIRQIIRVTRYREHLQRHKEPSQTVHYYVSNGDLTAVEYAQYIRQHWWIESAPQLHKKEVCYAIN